MRVPLPAWALGRAVANFAANDGAYRAGHVAFTAFLAFFPAIIFLSTLGGLLGTPQAAAHFLFFAMDYLPPEVMATLLPVVREVLEVRPGVMTLSLLGTLWVAGSGIEALRGALDHAHGVTRPRPFWMRRLHDTGLVLVGALAVLMLMAAVVFGPLIWRGITWAVPVADELEWLWTVARYGAGVLVLVVTATAFYRLLPNTRLRLKTVLPGAVLASGLWLAMATGFSIYLNQLGSYSVTYGSLGGVITTLMFFYISAALFIFGAEFNAALISGANRPPRSDAGTTGSGTD